MEDLINIKYVVNSLVYSGIGIFVLALGFIILDLITPYKLWNEIVEKKNTALSILVGSIAIGIALIISSAIHG